MSDPTNVLALDDVRLTLGADVLPIIAIESQIRDQLPRAWGLSAGGEGSTEMVSGIGEDVARGHRLEPWASTTPPPSSW